MTEQSRNFAVGITSLAGLLGLAFMLVLFGYVPKWAQQGYTVTVVMDGANGIHSGSRVQFGGIDIGEVVSVDRVEPMSEKVHIVTEIKPDESLPRGVSAEVKVASLLSGASVMSFVLPKDKEIAKLEPLPTDGTAVVDGRAAGMFDEVATSLKDVLAGPTATLNRVADDFNALSSEWTAVGTNIRRLTNPDVSPEQVDAGEAVANLATVLARADQRMAELEDVISGIDAYVNDEELRSDLKTTVANAREMTTKVMDTVESLRGDISGGVDALKKSYVKLADDLSEAVVSMQNLVNQMSEGEGTVGKLVKDPKLYDNLNDAAERLNTALDEIRLLVEKWKKEGLPIQF